MTLKPGDVVWFRDSKWKVTVVTPMRAVITPVEKVKRTIKKLAGEKDVEFMASGRALSISPNSDLPLVGTEEEENHGDA